MIRVDRAAVTAPADLDKRRRPPDNSNELERVRAHMAGPDRDKAFDFTAYSQGSVKAALDALFHGKCAYCESFYAKTQPVDVEHYRPKGMVEGEGAHPGYWWLAMVWTNLLPSCIDCNRRRGQRAPDADSPSMVRLQENGDFDRSVSLSSGKEAAFPLAAGSFRAAGEDDDCDQEQRLLLDPTRDDPDLHLAFHIDRANLIGLIYPRPLAPGVAPVLPNPAHDVIQLENQAVAAGISAPGAVSIQVYGLNRLALVQARTRVLRDLEFLVDLALGLEEVLADIADRIAAQTAARAAASARRRTEIGRELAFLTRVEARLRRHRDLTREHLRDKTSEKSPYTAMARAWVKAYLADN